MTQRHQLTFENLSHREFLSVGLHLFTASGVASEPLDVLSAIAPMQTVYVGAWEV